jgi:hypothetical protein
MTEFPRVLALPKAARREAKHYARVFYCAKCTHRQTWCCCHLPKTVTGEMVWPAGPAEANRARPTIRLAGVQAPKFSLATTRSSVPTNETDGRAVQ